MNIIKIEAVEISKKIVDTVSARDLHEFLGINQRFADWIKYQIERGFFDEGKDYLYHKNVINPTGGRPRDEYHLTLEAGKHIAMLSGSRKGKEVRDYFIECEERAKQVILPVDLPSALRAYADEVEKNQLLLDQVKQLEPKAKFYDDVAEAVNCVDIGAFGKSIGLSRNATFQIMREIGVLLKQGNSNVPYQNYIDKGYFVVIENVVDIGNTKKVIPQTMVTGSGQVFLHNILKSNGYAVNDEQQDLL